ncbi:MAG TPA: [dimethylamine--corrinoid protein] Co-methyltransferase, partial [Firmicutes bacterium]|nr:[dimethylamine--corrinoid protein] Co-methyltransferase [Bacillota bacterium]
MKEILTRMGDGERVNMSVSQVKEDLQAGTTDAADRGKIPELTAAELGQLLEIFQDQNRIVGVSPGEEVVLTHDIGTLRLMGDQANSGVGIPLSRMQGILVHERAFAADTMELGHIDYSFKPIKPVITMAVQEYELASLAT